MIFLTKTDKSLRATDVQYLEVEFIKLALQNKTADMDNKNGGNQNGYISEFDRAANDQFMQEALLLLEVIGITVFMKKNKAGQSVVATIPETAHTKHPRAWHPAIADDTFYYKTKNGGDAQMKWISPSEFVLLAGSVLGKSFSTNPSGRTAQKLRAQYADRINDYILNTDIIFTNPNPTSQIVIGGSANAWVSWKTAQKETLDKVIHRLNQVID